MVVVCMGGGSFADCVMSTSEFWRVEIGDLELHDCDAALVRARVVGDGVFRCRGGGLTREFVCGG